MRQSITKGESWYPMHKLEFLALKWSMTTGFHDYVYWNTFTKKSNNLLTYVLHSTLVRCNRTLVDGFIGLLQFQLCDIRLAKPALWWTPCPTIDWGISISIESVQAIFNAAMEGISPVAEICVHSAWVYLSPIESGYDPAIMSVKDWAKAQRADPDLKEVIKLYQETSQHCEAGWLWVKRPKNFF